MSWNFLFLLAFLLCAWCWLDWAKKALILAEVSSLVLGFELISRSRWRYTPPGVLRLSLFLIIIPPPDSMCRVRFKRKFRRFQNVLNLCHSGAEIYPWNEVNRTRWVSTHIRWYIYKCSGFYSGTFRRWYQWTDGTNGTIDRWLLPALKVKQTSGVAVAWWPLPQHASSFETEVVDHWSLAHSNSG